MDYQQKYIDPDVTAKTLRTFDGEPIGSSRKVLDYGIDALSEAGLTTLIGDDGKAYSLVVRLVRWPSGDQQAAEIAREE